MGLCRKRGNYGLFGVELLSFFFNNKRLLPRPGKLNIVRMFSLLGMACVRRAGAFGICFFYKVIHYF